ncbi:MAG TPA: hypothetical protein VFY93_16825 [Planctomycetota bacterium]|nr:hypothetical protein [Planctomycetota bacterium]
MNIRRFLTALLLGGGVLLAQGDPTPENKPDEKPGEAEAKPPEGVTFEDAEIQMFLDTFDQTYKNKDLPQDDAVATLANLKNAYNYLNAKGDQRTKEQTKLQKDIVERIAKKGLTAKKRPLVNLKCAEILGELGDEDAAGPLQKWLEGILDEKAPNPQAVEYGFQSLAWIGKEDKGTLEMVLDYASKGKHQDNTVAAQAIKACYQWRHLDGKTRKEFFDKICMFLEGLHSGMTGGDPKRRSTYETRYKAVENEGRDCLRELGDGTVFPDPRAARAWFNENKKGKWEDYIGPRFRKAAAPAPAGKEKEKEKEGGDAKPEG